MIRIATIGAMLLVPLGVASRVGAQQLDTVVGGRGTPTYGTITEVTRVQVTIDTNQGKRLFPVNEIQRVSYQGEPRELRNAREAISRGQWENGRSDLERIATSEISRREMLQDIEFYKAYSESRLAMEGGGDKSAAVRALVTFLEKPENATSLHYFTAVETLGDLAVAMGRYDAAVKYYATLGEAPWPDYQLRAAVLEGNAMLAQDQFPQALTKYDAVLASPVDDARAREQKQRAQLGRSVALAATGKADEGIASVVQIIEQNDSREKPLLFAQAYNALGTCYLKAGKSQDALLAFLHVDLLFHQDPAAHAEALYHLATLWSEVNRADRARQAKHLLETRYAGSPWASRN
jgi:tetratricopeptide (TPR) repeat protein